MTTDADLAIIIPLWRRTKHIKRVYRSARVATPNARIVFIASVDDIAVTDVLDAHHKVVVGDAVEDGVAVRRWPDHVEFFDPLVTVVQLPGPGGERGDYAAKINAGYRATSEPLLFTGADDLNFWPRWYEAARWEMDREGERVVGGRRTADGGLDVATEPLPRIGVVGTVDHCNARTADGRHSTHSLVARWYADQGGMPDADHVIYNEGYYHEYCDDELIQVAMQRGAYAHSYESVVEHLHPNVGKSPDDETYRRGRERSRLSRRLFLQRRRLWGGKGRPR